MSEVSPCKGCPCAERKITSCRPTCERLSAFQLGVPFTGLSAPDAYDDICQDENSSQDVCDIISEEFMDNIWGHKKYAHVPMGHHDNSSQNSPEEVLEAFMDNIETEKCLVNGCSGIDRKGKKRQMIRGLCKAHYKRWNKGFMLHPKYGKFDRTYKDHRKNVEEEIVEGRKDDKNKTDWSFLPIQALAGVAEILKKGSQTGIKFSKIYGAIIRHLSAWFFNLENKDTGSGEHHLCHIIANCIMLLTYIDKKEFDDRNI